MKSLSESRAPLTIAQSLPRRTLSQHRLKQPSQKQRLLEIGVAQMKQQVPMMPPIRRPKLVKRELQNGSRLRRILEGRRRRLKFAKPREQRRLERFPRIRPAPFGMTTIQPILKFHIRLSAGEIQVTENVLKPARQRGVCQIFRKRGRRIRQTLRLRRRCDRGFPGSLTIRHKQRRFQQTRNSSAAVSRPDSPLGRITPSRPVSPRPSRRGTRNKFRQRPSAHESRGWGGVPSAAGLC